MAYNRKMEFIRPSAGGSLSFAIARIAIALLCLALLQCTAFKEILKETRTESTREEPHRQSSSSSAGVKQRKAVEEVEKSSSSGAGAKQRKSVD